MVQHAEEARIRRSHLIREAVEVILLVGVIFLAIRFSLGTYRVQGPSMIPNFTEGQLMAANKLSYVFGKPTRGDIVVLDCHPLDPALNAGDNCVKRLIGLPGDTIEVTPTTVSVNGHLLNEPYIVVDANGLNNHVGKWILKVNEYFVMGDNRPVSQDSRVWGPVNKDLIVGKVFAVFYPLNNIHGIKTYQDVYKGL